MLSAIGDLHIEYLENHIPGIHKKVLSTFEKVVKREIDNGSTAIVQLGDAFDGAFPDQTYISAFLKSLHKVNQVPIYMIPGNHDFADVTYYALRTIRWLCSAGFIKGKVFIKPEVITIDDDKYLFCPHPYVVDTPPKGTRLCFGHFGYEGARGDNGYIIKSGNKPRGRWVLGDYHTKQRGKAYLYPGSLCQVKFHESPEKYIARIDDTVQTVQIKPDYRLGRVTINTQEELENLDPNTYWSVNISSKVKLAPDWATKYPQIIKHHAEKDVSKRQKVLMQQVAAENPLEGFGDYLYEEGMTRKEVRRTLQLMGLEEQHV